MQVALYAPWPNVLPDGVVVVVVHEGQVLDRERHFRSCHVRGLRPLLMRALRPPLPPQLERVGARPSLRSTIARSHGLGRRRRQRCGSRRARGCAT